MSTYSVKPGAETLLSTIALAFFAGGAGGLSAETAAPNASDPEAEERAPGSDVARDERGAGPNDFEGADDADAEAPERPADQPAEDGAGEVDDAAGADAEERAERSRSAVGDEPEPESPRPEAGPYRPGTTDLAVTTSLIGFPYLAAQPSLEIGLVELADGVILSGGGELDAGWCALCFLAGLAPGIESLSANYVSPRARIALHFNALGSLMGSEDLDFYFGGVIGPAFYSLSMSTDVESDFDSRVRTLLFGPVAGFRFTLEEGRGLFAAGELRFHSEVGRSVVRLTAEEEDEEVVLEGAADVERQGIDAIFGIGYRF